MALVYRWSIIPFAVFALLGVFASQNAFAADEASGADAEVADGTEESEIQFDRDLMRFLGFWRSLSDEERERLHEKLKDPEVREKIRSVLENPERLNALRSHRPELYKRFEKHWELETEYWELLKKYHDSTDESVQEKLKKEIRACLTRLVDAEFARRKGELEHFEKRIEWLKKRHEKAVEHRDEFIEKRLEEDLKELPPAPRPPHMKFGRGRPGPDRGPGRDGPPDFDRKRGRGERRGPDGQHRWRDRDDRDRR